MSEEAKTDDGNPVVGWGTTETGQHVPIRRDVADRLWETAETAKALRALDMPTEKDAISALTQAVHRLKELGWQDPIYAPKDGSPLDLIEPGSSGIHKGHYEGKWPDGWWYLHDADANGDFWPCRPVLARPAERKPC